jgi:hypothetical protein
MRKVLTAAIIVGLGVFFYNEYKKAKNTKAPKLK